MAAQVQVICVFTACGLAGEAVRDVMNTTLLVTAWLKAASTPPSVDCTLPGV